MAIGPHIGEPFWVFTLVIRQYSENANYDGESQAFLGGCLSGRTAVNKGLTTIL